MCYNLHPVNPHRGLRIIGPIHTIAMLLESRLLCRVSYLSTLPAPLNAMLFFRRLVRSYDVLASSLSFKLSREPVPLLRFLRLLSQSWCRSSVLLQIRSPQRSANGIGERKNEVGEWYHLEHESNHSEPGRR